MAKSQRLRQLKQNDIPIFCSSHQNADTSMLRIKTIFLIPGFLCIVKFLFINIKIIYGRIIVHNVLKRPEKISMNM